MKKTYFYTTALSLAFISNVTYASEANEILSTLYKLTPAYRENPQTLDENASLADIFGLIRRQCPNEAVPEQVQHYLDTQERRQFLNKFISHFNQKNFLSAAVFFQKALEKNDESTISHSDYFAASLTYEELASTEKYQEQKEKYLNSAQKMATKAFLKSETRKLRYLCKVANLAAQTHDYKALSKASAEIAERRPEESGYLFTYPRILDAYFKNDFAQAHTLVKLALTNSNNLHAITNEVCNNFITIAVINNDYELAFDIFKLTSLDNLFSAHSRNAISCLGRTFFYLRKTREFNALEQKTLNTGDVINIRDLCHVYESLNLFDQALKYWQEIISIKSSAMYQEAFQAFLSRAVVGEKNPHKRKKYMQLLKQYKRQNTQSTRSKESTSNSFSDPPKSRGHFVRSLIANQYSQSATYYLETATKIKAPELEGMKEIMRGHHATCKNILTHLLDPSATDNADNAPGTTSTDNSVIEIRFLMNEMKQILKTMQRENEVLNSQKKELLLQNTSNVRTPLPVFQNTNLRSEVLNTHGLPQARAKNSKTTSTTATTTQTTSSTQANTQAQPLYTIKWKWTHSAKKQNDDLSPETQTKLTTFMGEIEQNPWSVRRDGSLASGEPRYVNGIASHTFERDLDKYNRFIYHVLPTSEETATVTILKVMGHL